MLFVNRTNRINQDIFQSKMADLDEWVPFDEAGTHLAVFGGNNDQRTYTVLQSIARCCGKVGIVVIHDNLDMEYQLSRIGDRYEGILPRDTPVCFVNSRNLLYEPLYGMSINRAVETIYPQVSKDSPAYMQQHLCVEALRQYFRILQEKGVPLQLHNLLRLTSQGMEELDRRVLRSLDADLAKTIRETLSRDNIYRQVKADVDYFAMQLDGRIWKATGEPSDISIVSAAANRALLSVHVPANHTFVLDYLASELLNVLERNGQLLLVLDSVYVRDSLLFELLSRANDRMILTLSDSSMTGIWGSDMEEGMRILQRIHKILLFQAPNAIVAKSCSELIGNYMRLFVSTNQNESRGAFDLFSGHGKGESISEQIFERIRPEEFVNLGNGAVMIEQDCGAVSYAERFGV